MRELCNVISALVVDPDVVLFERTDAIFEDETNERILAEMRRRAPDRITILLTDHEGFRSLATHVLDVGAIGDVAGAARRTMTLDGVGPR
jgi:ABC-type histidine transport system ATPase subunit